MSNGIFVDVTSLVERDPAATPGVWSCKNRHRYRTRDLWPMRATEFEGVDAAMPYDFQRALAAEYGEKAFMRLEWEG